MQIKLLVEGGNMQPGPVLSQKIGPLGLNISQVIQKVNDATKNFQGLKVPVELDINPSTKHIEVLVFSPPVSELLKKELGIEKGSGNQKKTKVANASIEQVIQVAKTKLPNLLAKNFRAAVKTVVGSCVSLGVLVENKPAKEIEQDIDAGVFDNEILNEITKTPEEKKKKLDDFFAKVKAEQEKILKQEEEAAKAAEAEKAAAAPATATPGKEGEITPATAAGAKAPAAAKAPEEAKKGKEKK
jgi:large subunit ribosomal protein L11